MSGVDAFSVTSMLAGRHVLAGGVDDELLLPVDDGDVAVVVEAGDVAGVEPPVVVDRLRRPVLVVPALPALRRRVEAAYLSSRSLARDGPGVRTSPHRRSAVRWPSGKGRPWVLRRTLPIGLAL
jgi:hypothetical protein